MKALYKTYMFKDKDPIIELVRQCVDIFATVNSLSENRALDELSKASGVSKGTIYQWFYGVTRMPRFCCVAAVVRATGKEITVSGLKPQRSKLTHLRVVA